MSDHAPHESPHLAVVASTEFRRFHNALRILIHFNFDDLRAAGVLDDLTEFRRFDDDPYRFFIRADDARADALWALIQSRQPEALRTDPPLSSYALAAE